MVIFLPLAIIVPGARTEKNSFLFTNLRKRRRFPWNTPPAAREKSAGKQKSWHPPDAWPGPFSGKRNEALKEHHVPDIHELPQIAFDIGCEVVPVVVAGGDATGAPSGMTPFRSIPFVSSPPPH